MIVLGLDLSYSRSGLVWLEWEQGWEKPKTPHWTTITIPPGEWRMGRIQTLFYHAIGNQGLPDLAIIEGSIQRAGRWSKGKERKRGIKVLTMLQELNGVVKAVLDLHKIPQLESSPTHMKKVIAMKGTADKATVAREITARFGIEFPGDEKKGYDLYDAAGLALLGLKHRGMPL
jgi:hypothetical protein